jgi:hypothetical protein
MKNQVKLLFEQISNRIYKTTANAFNRIRIGYEGLISSPTVDESKVNYHLARSLMEGSVISDEHGNVYGEQYVLASAFAAPIVNSMTAIILSNPPSVTAVTQEGSEQEKSAVSFNDTMRKWYQDNQSTIFDTLVDSQAEGDAYIYVKNTFDAEAVQLLPEYIEKIVAPNDYTKTIGYEVTSRSRQFDDKGNVQVVKYKTIYREQYPYKVVIKYKANGEQSDHIVDVNGEETLIAINKPQLYMETLSAIDDYADIFEESGRFEPRPLPIVHIPFGKKAQSTYGESAFRNLYVYFLNYNRVIDHMLRNVIFNLISLPFMKGVDNVDAFLQQNGEWDPVNKEYRLKLDPKKIIFGGKDFSINMLTTGDVISPAEKALKILFYLIVQASETPEFFFGVSVNSSEASVKEQMPIIINKGRRYQNTYSQPMKLLFDTVAYYKALNGDVTVPKNTESDLSWGTISLDNVDSIIKMVDALEARELITDETKAKILGLAKYVSNISQEIKKARQEAETNGLAIDQRLTNASGDVPADDQEDTIIDDGSIEEEYKPTQEQFLNTVKTAALEKVEQFLNS